MIGQHSKVNRFKPNSSQIKKKNWIKSIEWNELEKLNKKND